MKKIIAIAFVLGSLVGCHKPVTESHSITTVAPESHSSSTESNSDAAAKAAINTALQVSELDASVLSKVADRLEGSCSRNKFGLSEDACIQAVRQRKDICTNEIAQKYPGQISNVDRMQEVASGFVNCVFEK